MKERIVKKKTEKKYYYIIYKHVYIFLKKKCVLDFF